MDDVRFDVGHGERRGGPERGHADRCLRGDDTLKVDGPVDTKLDLDRLNALDEKFKAGKMTEARAIATAIIDAAKAAGTIEVFAGAIITPDFGIGGGLSVLQVRGLAVNVGGGVVFSRAVESEEEIGKPPANAKDPFVLGRAPVLFVGASFNLK